MSTIPSSTLTQMIQVAPSFNADDEYQKWLDFVHAEIKDEGEDDAHYCEARED